MIRNQIVLKLWMISFSDNNDLIQYFDVCEFVDIEVFF